MSNSDIYILRKELNKAERVLFFEKEKKKNVENKKSSLDRYFNPENAQHNKLQKHLLRAREKIDTNIEGLRDALDNRKKLFDEAWKELLLNSDPSKNLNKLNSHFPILMFPLRLETRFKRNANGDVNQLWIRVFPDDCTIDSFEMSLSMAEIRNAQIFWTGWVASAGDENKMRGSWRSLTESHGVGRAQYITNNYQPSNLEDLLQDVQVEGDKLILAISVPFNSMTGAEKVSLGTYWIAVWKANGEINTINQALENIENDLGEQRTKEVLEQFVPVNFGDDFSHIENRIETEVIVRYVEFPNEDELEVGYQQRTWSKPPKVRVFPERFYLVGYRDDELVLEKLGNIVPLPLVCGPDPLADEQELVDYLDGDIKLSPQMKWMVDFDEAVKKGMGFVVTEQDDAQMDSGYDRLMVLGVRIMADKVEGKELTEELFANHYFGNSGFGFLPVGTPTNNLQEAPSGYTNREDADDSYDQLFKSATDSVADEAKSWWSVSDREWFNLLLGLSPDFLSNTANTNGFDQREIRAINTALWPATLGYFFESMMQPIFSEKEQKDLRNFFNFFVTARGSLPSIRIDDQPYGILPTTAFSRISWYKNDLNPSYHVIDEQLGSTLGFYDRLYEFFKKMQVHWKNMAKEVPHIHMPGDDPDQILLDVLGHHGGSVEFHARVGQSLNHLWNLYLLAQEQTNGVSAYEAASNYYEKFFQTFLGRLLLYTDFGYTGETPEILEKFFAEVALKIDELIHDQTLSENSGIRSYTSDDRNYIQWLIDAATTSFDILIKEKDGFIDGKKPNALLYTMLQHALEIGYFETGLRLYREAELITDRQMQMFKADPDFINIKELNSEDGKTTKEHFSVKSMDTISLAEKKFGLLQQVNPVLTGGNARTVAQHITLKLKEEQWKSAYVNQQISALEHIKNTSTAALERLLVEHLDCASYRFDSWKWGLINAQLLATRKQEHITSDNTSRSPDGLYVGAYAWLEDLRPDDRVLKKVQLNDEQLKEVFGDPAQPDLVNDSSNLGYIQAPSLNHAVTASILRNAYLARADEDNPELYNINLSSNRVRKALAVIEGIQNGQNLAAVLGYQFERFIHDSTAAEVDYLIFPLRRQFPLASDQLSSSQTSDNEYNNAPIEALEARNVIHGSDLIKFAEQRLGPDGEPNYLDEFNLEDLDDTEKTILVSAIDHIRDTNDAVSDLGLAESVHQVVQGNIDRAAGTLETYSKGNHPQVPDVIQTPRSGVNLTHRVGIQLNPNAAAGTTPRTVGEPAINEYLTDHFPKVEDIICTVDIAMDDLGFNDSAKITMKQLGLSPIDLLFIISDESEQAMALLDDLIVSFTLGNYIVDNVNNVKLRPDAEIKINYYVQPKDNPSEVSVFEMIPLVRHMRALFLRSRALRPSDVSLPNETGENVDGTMNLDINRITDTYNALQDIYDPNTANIATDPLLKLENDLKSLLDADQLNDMLANAENLGDQLQGILRSLALYGVPQTGFGSIYNWKKGQMEGLIKLAKEALVRYEQREQQYMELINQLSAGMSEDEHMKILINAELRISTRATIPPDLATFENEVTVVKKGAFDAAKQKIVNYIAVPHQTVMEALIAFNSAILTDYDLFDQETPDPGKIRNAFKIFIKDLYTRIGLLKKHLDKRYATCDDLLTQYSEEASPEIKVELIQNMGQTLFSEEFKMIPTFELLIKNQDEWSRAIQHGDNLLEYLVKEVGNPLPVDDWFYGVSRVREKMMHLEQCISLTEAFRDVSIDLTPVQFPYLEPYGWLAMEFGHPDEDLKEKMIKNFREHDHLLYTAYYYTPYDHSEKQCGVLIDEWTEVVPTEEETAGTAFHYDRPNSEAPQSMLLVCSPQLVKNWQWDDLIAALNETLDEAKLRGVEPEQIDKSGYSSFLPATLSAFTALPITAIANYAMSSNAYVNLVMQQNDE